MIGTVVAFVAGAGVVAVANSWRARRRRSNPVLLPPGVAYERVGNRGSPGRGVRASMLSSVREATDPKEAAAAGESELADDLRGYLGDVAAQHGADDAMFWLRRDDGAEFLPVAWNHRGGPQSGAWGTVHQRAIVAWAAAEGVVSFDGGERVTSLASARVSLDSVATLGTAGTSTGALVLHAPLGIRSPRGELKLWLPRHAERLTQLVEMQLTRTESTRQNRIMRVLVRAAQNLGDARTQQELEHWIVKDVVDASGATFAALVEWNAAASSGNVRSTTAFYPEPQPHAGDPVESRSTVGEVCIEGTQQHWTDAAHMVGPREAMFSQGTPFPQCGTLAILPMRRRKNVIGAIVIGATEPGSLRAGDLRSIGFYALLAGAALEASWEIEEVKTTARIDQLTGLANRRAFDDELLRALDQTDRFGGGCALVLADVDHFKTVNDSYGHEAGDRVLKAIAEVLRETVRTTDISARIGGEEFCVILQQTGAQGAIELAERLRTKVEALAIRWRDRDVRVTSSFGVATYEAGGGQAKRGQLFDATDRALYRAKREGRNCVRTA
jgi:diguanylate cyclase (GGDEF)-like protein